MRAINAIGLVVFLTTACCAQKHGNAPSFPNEIVIGRDSFIDVGPPFHYYDLTILRSVGDATEVERVRLTPPADACNPRAEIKLANVVLQDSLSSLLHETNPCTIPEKALNAESKRRKKGRLVFSGMIVSTQMQCGDKIRVIRTDILDRDIFEKHPDTPRYTARSQSLLEKLDQVTGDRPWDTPVFPMANGPSPDQPSASSEAVKAIADGKYDAVFGDIADRPSELYRLAQLPSRQPTVELIRIDPVRPTVYVDPAYPPIAKAAHVQGTIEFRLSIVNDGIASDVSINAAGPKMLWRTVTEAIAKWKFSPEDSGKVVQGAIRFGMNCASETK